MSKKDREFIARRAWNIIASLWTRKGGSFKRRLMMELRVVPKFLKSLGHNTTPGGQLSFYNRERELSFDNTPIFHVKMNKPTSMRYNIPCLTAPRVDFDYDFDQDSEDHYEYCVARRRSSLTSLDDEEGVCEDEVLAEEEEIDLRAENFIAKFYEQMKLQRQISYRHYNEMKNIGTS